MKQQASRQSVKDFKLIAEAYFRLLSAYKKDGEFLFRLSRKELLILGFDKIVDFRGEWVIDDADKWYEPSDWEHVQCLANWDKPAFDKENPVFYRDDLRFIDCDAPIQPIPGEKEIKCLWVFENASALCDAICGWLKRQSGLLEDKFIGWPGTAFFEGYFPQWQSHIERYTLNDITKNKSEYFSRLQSIQMRKEASPDDIDVLPHREIDYVGRRLVVGEKYFPISANEWEFLKELRENRVRQTTLLRKTKHERAYDPKNCFDTLRRKIKPYDINWIIAADTDGYRLHPEVKLNCIGQLGIRATK